MPRSVRDLGDRSANQEVDALWREIDALRRRIDLLTAPAQEKQRDTGVYLDPSAGLLIVREVDGSPSLEVRGIEFDQADGFAITMNGDVARVDLTSGVSYGGAPPDIASAGAAGTASTVSRSDHTHRGVTSVNKSGSSALYGAVTLSAGSGVTLTQAGQDVNIKVAGSTYAGYGGNSVLTGIGTLPQTDFDGPLWHYVDDNWTTANGSNYTILPTWSNDGASSPTHAVFFIKNGSTATTLTFVAGTGVTLSGTWNTLAVGETTLIVAQRTASTTCDARQWFKL